MMHRLTIACFCAILILGISPARAVHAEASLDRVLSQHLQDSDGDGIPDAWESVYGTDPQVADTDGDGYVDGEEVVNGFSPVGSGELSDHDTDGDGLTDRLELLFGSDPQKRDTDNDGYADGREIAAGFSPTSTSTNPLTKEIDVQLSTQRMSQVLGGVTLATYQVSTGKKGMATPTGEFAVLSKNPRAWSKRAGLWMPWWMEFSRKGYGIHELPEWPGGYKEGAAHLGKPVSHGCVRLGVGPAKTLYEWAPVGTKVVIRH